MDEKRTDGNPPAKFSNVHTDGNPPSSFRNQHVDNNSGAAEPQRPAGRQNSAGLPRAENVPTPAAPVSAQQTDVPNVTFTPPGRDRLPPTAASQDPGRVAIYSGARANGARTRNHSFGGAD